MASGNPASFGSARSIFAAMAKALDAAERLQETFHEEQDSLAHYTSATRGIISMHQIAICIVSSYPVGPAISL